MFNDDKTQFPWYNIDAWKGIHDLKNFSSMEWTERIQKYLTPSPRLHAQQQREQIVRIINSIYPKSVKRLQLLEKRLQEIFVKKDEIIKMIIVSAIAQQPLLIIGPPGTAKSLLISRFCEGLGVTRTGKEKNNKKMQTVFQYLLHSFTEPDEIMGPVEIEKLKKEPPEFVRFRDGSITDSEVIFLDEVFKTNSAILNALLTIINERRVYEGGISLKAKARLIFGASNKPPTRKQFEELEAFYERFIIRMQSLPIEKHYTAADDNNMDALLKNSWSNE
ncbi:MAG: AAA domain-containing protein, partial [bacterium]|nr:AAA domain-containing protein [bacterium]